ncbi:YebG protein domain-containing protein [Desulfonema limicola]|uniref:YebG protein domain-containing protein n=1 Tax=Desulfonema limicola TaxID=45656 RepID=A0A975BBG3_9BACT|nr:YebG family protein [Desulfonema limicola]QTA82312.1 YebG protein domain-containing protein [Desulfonema limicola]
MQDKLKYHADAYDKMLDAAAELADLIEQGGIKINEYDLEELTIFLAVNAHVLRDILKPVKSLIHNPDIKINPA